jgi:hypothetical protein
MLLVLRLFSLSKLSKLLLAGPELFSAERAIVKTLGFGDLVKRIASLNVYS